MSADSQKSDFALERLGIQCAVYNNPSSLKSTHTHTINFKEWLYFNFFFFECWLRGKHASWKPSRILYLHRFTYSEGNRRQETTETAANEVLSIFSCWAAGRILKGGRSWSINEMSKGKSKELSEYFKHIIVLTVIYGMCSRKQQWGNDTSEM